MAMKMAALSDMQSVQRRLCLPPIDLTATLVQGHLKPTYDI